MTPTPAAQPEAVVPEVLEKCARLLGPSYRAENTGVEQCGVEPMRDVWNIQLRIFDGWITMSDGDLLLAILNKAHQMGRFFTVYRALEREHNRALNFNETSKFTETVLLAFAQLERAHD
jgi:hypothetical protein